MRFGFWIICVQLIVSARAQGQDLSYPQIRCGNSFYPSQPATSMLVKPIGPADSFHHEMKVDGVVLGSYAYPRWKFELVQAVEGFCPQLMEVTIDFGQDSLLQQEVLFMEMGGASGVVLAQLSLPDASISNREAHIREVHGGSGSRLAKVVKVEYRREELDLVSLGLQLALPDSLDYGYDTAVIEDHYYVITFQNKEGQFQACTRDSIQAEVPLFQVGDQYLMRLEGYNETLWIANRHLYKKGYHLQAYFEAYEKLD